MAAAHCRGGRRRSGVSQCRRRYSNRGLKGRQSWAGGAPPGGKTSAATYLGREGQGQGRRRGKAGAAAVAAGEARVAAGDCRAARGEVRGGGAAPVGGEGTDGGAAAGEGGTESRRSP